MTARPVLFAGGSGNVGRHAIRWFRERHPSVPILVGGRNLEAAEDAAREAGAARAVIIDMTAPRLGLPDGVVVDAVVMLAPDDGLKGLRYSQDLGVPYLDLNTGLVEVGPAVALFAHRAAAAPVILASHWAGGAALFLTLNIVKAFDTVRSIRVGVVVDEEEPTGPLATDDMRRLDEIASTLVFEGGRRVWLSNDSASGEIEAIDGRLLGAKAFSSLDLMSIYAAIEAPSLRFDLAAAESSSRRRGGGVAAEIVVDVEGEADGATKRSRSTLEFRDGQASLTALCVVLSLSAALGLNDRPASLPGLYMPELLSDAEWALGELRRAGAVISEESR